MPKKRITAAQSLRWGIIALVVLLITGFCVTWFEQQRIMSEKQASIDELNRQLDEMYLTAAALEADLEFSKTDAYIERLAREELGYVKEGEIKFITQDEPDDNTGN